MTSPAIALVVHGHFYQPPRENPWTDDLQREPSAAPAHDWNARIHAECYRANAFARIHDPAGHIRSIVNNYERLSYNFGPTLARWIARFDARAHARLQAADAEQRQRLGHGGALAQAYAHPIVPLCNAVDRRTQVLWGLQDFRRRFGRDAEGIWLPETAASARTLETLIDLGVRFTILAPEQIAAVRPIGDGGKWSAVTRDTLDTGRAYRWRHPDGSGRWIDLAVFDGPLSRAVAFGEAMRRAEAFLDDVESSAARSKVTGQRLVLCASDGELFGHHKKFADLALAFAGFVEAPRRGIEVTNLAAYLAAHPPTWEAKLDEGPDGEGTAWSCQHGVGRWRRDCGCNMGGAAQGWNQAWRGPLRSALDRIRDAAADLYEDASAELLEDPWGARDAYGEVVDEAIDARDRLLAQFGRPALAQDRDGGRQRARLLLEMQRATILMYASCGWFFDDIAGLESSLVLRLGAHAVELFGQIAGASSARALSAEVLEILDQAKSNRPEEGTGADVYRRVAGQRVTAAQAVATAALGQVVAGQGMPSVNMPAAAGFDVDITASAELGLRPSGAHRGRVREPSQGSRQIDGHMAVAGRGGATFAGQARAVHQRTGVALETTFEAQSKGGVTCQCRVGGEVFTLADLGPDERDGLLRAALPLLLETDGARDLKSMRQVFETARTLTAWEDGELPPHRRLFAAMLIDLLSRPRAALGADALAFAVELFDAAALPAGAAERRVIEELVSEQMAEAVAGDGITLLAKRLGFASEAGLEDATT